VQELPQLLKVRHVNDVRHIEVKPSFSPDSGPSQVETAIVKLKRYKLADSNKITSELISAGGETV
jgi:hypothetical protein